MALTAVECPGGVCHSHHGGHAVQREQLRDNLAAHGPDWCERLAERVYEISVDSFSQTVMPHLHQDGWQRRHLDWEFKLQSDPAEAERTLVDGAINAVESFLRSSEVQRLFVQELVHGTLAEAEANGLRSLVRVTLAHGDREAVGFAEGSVASSARHRLVAAATLDALRQVQPAAECCDVDAAQILRVGAEDVAVVTATFVLPTGEQVLSGSAVVRRHDESAAIARAVLDATNRRLAVVS